MFKKKINSNLPTQLNLGNQNWQIIHYHLANNLQVKIIFVSQINT